MQLPKSLNRLLPAAGYLRPENWQQSLPIALSALLAIVLAWQVVQVAWKLLGASPASTALETELTQDVQTPAASPAFDLDTIVSAHLFGVASAGDTDPSAAPATQMSLVLVGTIAQTDPERGVAIIGESASSAKVYTVGRTITGGTKLHSVYPDRVILDRGGKLEALMLPKQFKGGGPAPRVASQPEPSAAPPMLGDRIRELAEQNPSAITEIIRPQPVFSSGQQRGYRVYPGRNRQQFARLGLMPGDLVTSINGAPLDDPARGMEILQSMNSATSVTMTVERNGQTTQISINNAQVAADAAAAAAEAAQSDEDEGTE